MTSTPPMSTANSAFNSAVAFLLQQQAKNGSSNAASASLAAPSFDSARAQVLLKQQEDQLRATRLMLQQRQLDDLVAQGAGRMSISSSNPSSRSNSLLAQCPSASSGLLGLSNAAALASSHNALAALAAVQTARRSSSIVSAASTSAMEAAAKVTAEEDPEDEEDDMTDEEFFKTAAEGKDGESPSAASDDEDGRGANESFPHKLYRMLYEVERDGHAKIVSFLPTGRGFTIHRPKDFVAEIMPRYFTTRRVASFQRQLNLYGFRRISEGRDKGAYFHKDFVKGKRSRVHRIKRKSNAARAAGSATADPFATQFSSMQGMNSMTLLDRDVLLARMAAAAVANQPSSSSTPIESPSLLEITRRGVLANSNAPTGMTAQHHEILRNAAASLLAHNSNRSY